MRSKNVFRWLTAAGALLLSSLATAQVRVSEIHYDNTGADTGEAIEVSGPAGTDVTGWTIVLYNGNGGASYDTKTLSGAIPATCSDRGVLVINYPVNGIQNGDPDGVALVDSGGHVVEYLSYEGTFAATNGPAAGLTSADIGARESGNDAVGLSLQRDAAGVWALAPGTFGACNDNGTTPPPPVIASVTIAPASATLGVGASLSLAASAFDASNAPINNVTFAWTSSNPAAATVSGTGVVTGVAEGDTTIAAAAQNGVAGSSTVHVTAVVTPPPSDFHINEIHYDNVGTDAGEAIEVEGPAGASVDGFSVVLYDGNGGVAYNTATLAGGLPASCVTRGVSVLNYPSNGIQNGSPDGIALVNAAGQVLEFVSYEGVFTATSGPAMGLTSTDIGASQTNAPIGTSLQRNSAGVWNSGLSTFGACNGDDTTPPANNILITGRTPTDAPLPVGYEDQLFAQLRNASNQNLTSTYTWVAETPDLATIEQNGVFHAFAAGSARFRVTAADGTTATITLPTIVAVRSSTALYANNTEFGDPVDSDSSDDIIVRRAQYTTSYSPLRNSPNWVAYEIDPTHFGAEDRCDCFTMDPELPSSLPRITTDDYTGAGAIAGYGIDRGHLARSFDRTSASLDNATTFLLSNIMPQASDQNQGPWAALENDLGDFVRTQDKEVYVIAGVAGNKGTLKNLGKVIIPAFTWKVALILPHDHGLADVHDYRDVQAIAVIMPNEPGVRNVPWQSYLTTVDAVEALSGYDLLAALPDEIETAVESNTQPPIAAITGPANINEGDSATFNASGSVDPNGTVVSYAWSFGDGSTGEGVAPAHVYAQDGTYTVTVAETDNDGLVGHSTFTINVANVAPVIAAIPDGTVNVDDSYAVSGTFADPGTDAWTVSVNWGDGASGSLSVASRAFALSHVYAAAGTYTVTISVADDDATTSSAHTVTVVQPAPALAQAITLLDQLVAAKKVPKDVGTVLKAELVAAQKLIARGAKPAAKVMLSATVVELDLLVRLKVLTAANAAPLRALLVQVIGTL
jgi:DNA/RNA endonuclease G (NUC1)